MTGKCILLTSAAVTFNKAKKELDIMNAEEYRAYRTVSNPLSDMGASTDWFDAVTRLGVTHMHTLTFSEVMRGPIIVTADYRKAQESTCVRPSGIWCIYQSHNEKMACLRLLPT